MKKINHLGVIERVPFHFESVSKTPLITLATEAVFLAATHPGTYEPG
jgi:hypothetical protein